MNRHWLYVLIPIMVGTAFSCLWYFPAEYSYKECVKQPAISERSFGHTAEGCSISEITLRRKNSNYKCYLDTFKMIRCPTSTRVPGAESMTSTGFMYKSGDDAITTP